MFVFVRRESEVVVVGLTHGTRRVLQSRVWCVAGKTTATTPALANELFEKENKLQSP